MLLNTKKNVKRSGMILLIVVAFLSMFLVVGTTYLLVADSIRRTSDFDLNATDKRSDYALMTDIDPRYMFNFALGQILYDVADPVLGPDAGGKVKVLTTNSALRGHSLARDIYGGYNPAGLNDRPFQGTGKTPGELGQANNIVRIDAVGAISPIFDPEKGQRTGAIPNTTRISSWNPPYTFANNHHLYLGSFKLDTAGNITGNPSFTGLNAVGPNLDVKNLEGYPGGNDSYWIDAGFPVMTTPDGRKYKALIAPLILDLDGRINLNVAGNLMQRDAANPNFTADHASNQGWGRWEINPQGLIGVKLGRPVIDKNDPKGVLSIPVVLKGGNFDFPPIIQISGGGGTGATATAILVNKALDSIQIDNAGTGYTSPPDVRIINEFFNLLSYGTTSGTPAAASNVSSLNQWKTYGRLFHTNYLPINGNPPPDTNFLTNSPHSYAKVDFNAAGDFGAWGSTTKPTFVDPNTKQPYPSGFLSFGDGNGNGFGNGQESEHLLDGNSANLNYHARNFNPYRSQSSGNNVSTVFPVSETASILRWQGKGEPFSKSQLAQLLPKSLGLDMPYASVFLAQPPIPPNPLPPLNPDVTFRQRIRNMVTTLSADLDRPAMVPIQPDSFSAVPVRFDYKLSSTFSWLPRKSAQDELAVSPNSTTPALKLNLNRKLTNFPDCVPIDPTTLYGNFYDTANPTFADAVKERQAFAREIFNHLRSVLGIIKVEDPLVGGRPPSEQQDIKKINLFCAQLAVNIVDYLDYDDVITPFQWNGREWVFGTELPRLVINEVYCQAQNKKSEGPFDKSGNAGNKKASDSFDINTFVELYNPLPDTTSPYLGNDPDDPIKYKDTSTPPVFSYKLAGSHSAVLQYKNGEKTKDEKGKDIDKEFPNYRVVLANRNKLSPTLSDTANYDSTNNSGVNTVWNNTGMTWFNLDASKFDKTTYNPKIEPNEPEYDVAKDLAKYKEIQDPDDPDPAKKVKVRSQIKKWKDSSTLADYKSNWIVAPSKPYVVSDSAQLRPKTDPGITAQFQSPDLDLISPISDYAATNAIEAPSVLLQRLAIPGYPRNEIVDPLNGTLQYPNQIPNPFITVDVFSGTTIVNNVEAGNDGDPNTAIKYDKDDNIPNGNFKSVGRNNMFLDSAGGNAATDLFKLTGSSTVVQQKGKNTMGNTNTEGNLVNTVQSTPWLTHLDRSLINPLELIYVSCYRPTLLSQMANRWGDSVVQGGVTTFPFAANWPWFDENTRLYRFLEAVGVSPLQAGEAMHGRALGKVNVNTMHSEEVFQAVADAAPANNFTAAEVTTGYNNLIGQMPILSFGQANQPANQTALGVKTGLNRSLMGYSDLNIPYRNFLDNDSPDPMNPLFQSTGTKVATYFRKELLTKIGNSVTTRSNVFAVWITTGYFEVTDDTTQPPTLGLEIGRSDGINIRHRMFAIVDRTNMVTANAKVYNAIAPSPLPQQFFVYPVCKKNTGGRPGTASNPSPYNPNNDNYLDFYNGNSTALRDGLILTFDPNTDNEETVVLIDSSGNGVGPFQAIFQKAHSQDSSVINRGNPGPWVGYDRTKDRDVVPYAEIIE